MFIVLYKNDVLIDSQSNMKSDITWGGVISKLILHGGGVISDLILHGLSIRTSFLYKTINIINFHKLNSFSSI